MKKLKPIAQTMWALRVKGTTGAATKFLIDSDVYPLDVPSTSELAKARLWADPSGPAHWLRRRPHAAAKLEAAEVPRPLSLASDKKWGRKPAAAKKTRPARGARARRPGRPAQKGANAGEPAPAVSRKIPLDRWSAVVVAEAPARQKTAPEAPGRKEAAGAGRKPSATV